MDARPMFPLGTVLFPHMPLALRLFEPRYLQMLGQLLEQPDPAFGVVLIERGHEVGGGDHRFPVGTMARLVQVESGADAMAVMAVGARRFRVNAWLPDDPYPAADVDLLPDLQWHEDLADDYSETERAVRHALSVCQDAVWPADIELADDPVAACWQLAAITPVGALDHLDLLQSADTADLLRRTAQAADAAREVAGW